MLRVVTLNTLVDLSDWDLRGQVIVDSIRKLQPDLVAFQEVVLPINTAQWVADQLDGYQVYLTSNAGMMGEKEALAVLSRLQVLNLNMLDLVHQNRKAQVLTILDRTTPFLFTNTHLLWQDDPAPQRMEQAEIITNHLDLYPAKIPKIICGDFNTLPGSPTYHHFARSYNSVYPQINNQEPDLTFPSPLNRQKLRDDSGNLYQAFLEKDEATKVLDYIFISSKIEIKKCEIAFNSPHKEYPQIYASDHYGLVADLVF